MVVDTSAIIALLRSEPESDAIAALLCFLRARDVARPALLFKGEDLRRTDVPSALPAS
jgi:uncharacterized protein with PIN domain